MVCLFYCFNTNDADLMPDAVRSNLLIFRMSLAGPIAVATSTGAYDVCSLRKMSRRSCALSTLTLLTAVSSPCLVGGSSSVKAPLR